MDKFYKQVPEEKKVEVMRKLHSSMLARLDFYRNKLQGIESYAHVTLARLDIQRSAVRHLSPQSSCVTQGLIQSSSTTSSPKRNPS